MESFSPAVRTTLAGLIVVIRKVFTATFALAVGAAVLALGIP